MGYGTTLDIGKRQFHIRRTTRRLGNYEKNMEFYKMKRNKIRLIIFCLIISSFLIFFVNCYYQDFRLKLNNKGNIIDNQQDSSNSGYIIESRIYSHPIASYIPSEIKLYYFLNNGCDICLDKRVWLRSFNTSHPELEYIEVEIYAGDLVQDEFANNYFSTFPNEIVGIPNPSVVFDINNTCKIFIGSKNLEYSVVEEIYNYLINPKTNDICKEIPSSMNGWIIYGEYNLWLSFITGIVSGLSPCIILITAAVGGSFFSFQEKSKFIFTVIGFVIGILGAYLLIGILFSMFYDIAVQILGAFWLKLIIGIPLILLGVWYIVDAWNKKSKLFSTPEKLKNLFKKLARKQNIIGSIILGLAFTILKSPCVAAILLSLLFDVLNFYHNTGLILSNILLFSIGVIIPIIIVAIILRSGMSSKKLNEKREQIRPYLRLISGIIIIILTSISLF
ncbi:MAG: cytochrome c biogenesis CcdA family protein [Promethearchaeota archaeon]